MRILAVFLYLLSIAALQARSVRDTLITVTPGTWYDFSIDTCSGVSVQLLSDALSDQLLKTDHNAAFLIYQDPHADASAPVVFSPGSKKLSFYSGSYRGNVVFYFFSIAPLPAHLRITRHTAATEDCLPEIVPPSVWRAGLSAPSYTPSKTQTTHIIVHHAATGNQDPDAYQTVRSIYVQHTQINGWSDMGYNYLIGRDGTIFQGRDSKGLFDPDYTVGAHMCGKNNNTMGICLLGNYVSEKPTPAALRSLERLIAWKSSKDNISIKGSSLHPVGPSGEPDRLLAHVAGHREGCRSGYTECPGNGLFSLLSEIRFQSESLLAGQCTNDQPPSPPVISDSLSEKHLIYPNPSSDYIEASFVWDTVMIYDVSGKLFLSQSASDNGTRISVNHLTTGIYICRFIIAGRNRYLRLMIEPE